MSTSSHRADDGNERRPRRPRGDVPRTFPPAWYLLCFYVASTAWRGREIRHGRRSFPSSARWLEVDTCGLLDANIAFMRR